jgi:hypothetical protein
MMKGFRNKFCLGAEDLYLNIDYDYGVKTKSMVITLKDNNAPLPSAGKIANISKKIKI